MGLLSLIPPGNPLSVLSTLSRPLNDVGYGLMKGKTFREGLAEGAEYSQKMAPYRMQEMQRQDELNQVSEQKNATVQAMLEAGREDLANMAEAGQMAMAWKLFAESRQPGGGAQYGLTPIWGTDAQGNPVMGQMSNQGGIQPVQTPEGMTFGKDPIRIDGGNQTILLDPVTRQPIGSIPKSGNVPTGYEAMPGGEIAPMQGSPQELELQQAEIKAGSALNSLEQKNEIAIGAIDTALQQANGLTSGIASVTSSIPGTPAHDLARTLDTIKANIGFEELQAMRDNSPTGGALGQVTERELAFLQSTIANIEQSQSEAQLKANLKTLRDFLAASLERRRAAYQQQYGSAGGGSIDDILSTYGL